MIEAKCINDVDPWGNKKLPIIKGHMYKVEHIDMGQSYTSVSLDGIKGTINSVCLRFYENGKPINIYNDKRFNPYL